MTRITLPEAQQRLPEIIDSATPGETIEILRDGRVVARLVPVAPAPKDRQPGSARDLIVYMAPDFDEPLEDFRDYKE